MSTSQALLASARSAYRTALRASASTFSGDLVVRNGKRVWCVSRLPGAYHVVAAFRAKVRNELLPYDPKIDPKLFEEKVTLVRDVADVLRRNIVQARKVEEPAEANGKELWGASEWCQRGIWKIAHACWQSSISPSTPNSVRMTR